MKSMLRILAAVPFLFCWGGPSAAAGGNWVVNQFPINGFQWPYTPCVGESLTVDMVFTEEVKLVAQPSGGYVQRIILSLEGTATGDSTGNHYKVWAHEMMGLHGFNRGSSQSSDTFQWMFTPVTYGVKFRWEGNQVMKWAGEPWNSELLFDMNHNNTFDPNEWGNHASCMGPSK